MCSESRNVGRAGACLPWVPWGSKPEAKKVTRWDSNECRSVYLNPAATVRLSATAQREHEHRLKRMKVARQPVGESALHMERPEQPAAHQQIERDEAAAVRCRMYSGAIGSITSSSSPTPPLRMPVINCSSRDPCPPTPTPKFTSMPRSTPRHCDVTAHIRKSPGPKNVRSPASIGGSK